MNIARNQPNLDPEEARLQKLWASEDLLLSIFDLVQMKCINSEKFANLDPSVQNDFFDFLAIFAETYKVAYPDQASPIEALAIEYIHRVARNHGHAVMTFEDVINI